MKQVVDSPLRSVRQKRQTLVDLAYTELLDAILWGRLPPGESLGLDHLARMLEMSRTPVNLALSRLHAEGLVSYAKHVGFYVLPLEAKDLTEVFDLRLMYEPYAVASGLPTATHDQIAAIAAVQDRISSTTGGSSADEYRVFWELDGQFHRLLVRLSPNDLLQEWFARLHHRSHVVRLGLLALLAGDAGQYANMLREHGAIVDALRQRDVSAVQSALRGHIERSRDVALARLSTQPSALAAG